MIKFSEIYYIFYNVEDKMEYSSLYDMINFLKYGTKLHIGVLFFGNYGNEKCVLPKSYQIHSGKACEKLKIQEKNSFKRCLKCRNMAISKALNKKEAFGGLCINGIYEYTRPVVINGEVACVIFIGNIFESTLDQSRIRKKICGDEEILETMEKDFGKDKCEAVGKLLESYIRVLLEKYERSEKIHPLIENIKSYINSNIESEITLSHIAEVFHYNKTYLGRLFKEETGKTFIEYINEKRLIRAKKMLENTKETILNISTCTGFNNVTYFNRLFKKSYGVSPTEYRNYILL